MAIKKSTQKAKPGVTQKNGFTVAKGAVRAQDAALQRAIYTVTGNHTYVTGPAPVKVLIRHLGSFEQYATRDLNYYDDDGSPLSDFLEYLTEVATVENVEALDRINRGFVEFQDLFLLFKVGSHICLPGTRPLWAGEVIKTRIEATWGGTYFVIDLKTINAISGKPRPRQQEVRIEAFSRGRPLAELPAQLLTTEQRAQLTERGRVFCEMSRGAHYMHFEGQLVRRSWFGSHHFRADGRVMVDGVTFGRMDQNYVQGACVHYLDGNGAAEWNIPDDQLWMCEPFVYGFSFAAKKWGELAVEGLRPVNFQSDAFDTLVMDPVPKKTILALVKNFEGGFADVVEGKGGGCIFLLHGPPGTGKTLTAEAVAEVLKRPLYSISVGELGTGPEQLEETLREILDVSMAWRAVILLDEADIFLEKRDEHNIIRNAMVGVFLRLLEYHQGVLFLTTNRVKQFDRAFASRVSVALHYPAMTDETRNLVWRNLGAAAGLPANLNYAELATYVINGRQIKTTIRLAQTLAKSENREVEQRDLVDMIDFAQKFEQDLQFA